MLQNASSAKVGLSDGNSYDATLKAADPANDIAVLKINSNESQNLNLTPINVGTSHKLLVGMDKNFIKPNGIYILLPL